MEHYHKIGQDLIDSLKLTTFPMAVRMISPGEEPPAEAIRPLQAFGSEVPACLVFNWCRRSGFSFYLTKDDIACKPIVIYFGLDRSDDPDDLYYAWEMHGGYKRDAKAEKQSRKDDACFEYGEYDGIAISPLHQTVFTPDLAMVYCTPLTLSHLVLSATYDGENLTSHFNGMESSCKEGIIRTHKTGQCQVVAPGMGDRVLGGVQDHEMIFSMPEAMFETVSGNLFQAGSKISPPPFQIPHQNATLGSGKLFGAPGEPGDLPLLREKFGAAKEK